MASEVVPKFPPAGQPWSMIVVVEADEFFNDPFNIRKIEGPVYVRVTSHPDGGVETTVFERPQPTPLTHEWKARNRFEAMIEKHNLAERHKEKLGDNHHPGHDANLYAWMLEEEERRMAKRLYEKIVGFSLP